MRASWEIDGRLLRLTLRPDQDDTLTSPRPPHLRMVTNVATIKLPVDIPRPHSDLLALAAYAVAWPWTTSRLVVDTPVSDQMTEAFASAGIVLSSRDGGVADPRPPGPRVSLAYSGGSDSIATARVLPEDTAFVHLRRVANPRVVNRMTHVRVDVIEGLVRRAADRGRDVSVVQTDLEYLCLPYATYPVWWAISIASIVLADHTDAGGVALGTVLESRYTANGTKWVGRGRATTTHGLYAAAGIPLIRPAAGMTEVITTELALSSDLGDLARSCLLGSGAGPCLRCDKCVRKELLMSAVTGESLPSRLVDNMKAIPAMTAKFLQPPPLYFQDMIEYSLSRVDVSDTPLEQVYELLQPKPEHSEWAQRYYPHALVDEVPDQFRPRIAKKVEALTIPMDEADIAVVETWNAAARVPGVADSGMH